MTALLYAATTADPSGLPSLAVYGVAAFPISLLIWAIRWQQGQMAEKNAQMAKKDEAIEKLNDRLIVQGDMATKQAERLAPLINDASRVLNQAVEELAPRYKDRRT